MKRHDFRGKLGEGTCADCKVEARYIDEAQRWVYRVPGGDWTTERPACRPVEQPKASEVRA